MGGGVFWLVCPTRRPAGDRSGPSTAIQNVPAMGEKRCNVWCQCWWRQLSLVPNIFCAVYWRWTVEKCACRLSYTPVRKQENLAPSCDRIPLSLLSKFVRKCNLIFEGFLFLFFSKTASTFGRVYNSYIRVTVTRSQPLLVHSVIVAHVKALFESNTEGSLLMNKLSIIDEDETIQGSVYC